jgi:hypothetical protein
VRADHHGRHAGRPEGGDLHLDRDIVVEVEVKQHDVHGELRMGQQPVPRRHRDDGHG